MFYVELKNNNKDIYEVDPFFDCKVKFDHILNVRYLNALIARGMAIQKVFPFVRDASNVQEIIQPSIVRRD